MWGSSSQILRRRQGETRRQPDRLIKVLCCFDYEKGGENHPDAVMIEVASSHDIHRLFEKEMLMRRVVKYRFTHYITETGLPKFYVQ